MSVEALVERYEAGAALLEYAAAGLTTVQEQARPGPGTWSIAELVAHLVDCDLVGSDRMKRVIAEENPDLLAFDQDAWLSRLGGSQMPVAEGVALFSANRRWTSRILRHCGEAQFTRAGMHSENGRQSLAELVVKFANHLDHHLKFLYGKRAALGVSLYPRYTRESSV